MNTLFSKKLLAIVISGLFLGGTLSGEVYALQVNTIEPVTANPKKHKHEHSESEENHVEEGHQENEGNHSEKDTEHDEHGHDQESKNKETEE